MTLPSGTVTFLFSDVEGSTELARRLGDQFASALQEHSRLLHDAVDEHGGHVIGSQGDSLFVEVTDFNEETWFDRAGDFHSDQLHVTQRYTPTSDERPDAWPSRAAGSSPLSAPSTPGGASTTTTA